MGQKTPGPKAGGHWNVRVLQGLPEVADGTIGGVQASAFCFLRIALRHGPRGIITLLHRAVRGGRGPQACIEGKRLRPTGLHRVHMQSVPHLRQVGRQIELICSQYPIYGGWVRR